LKLSTRTRYGTRALLDLARHRGDKPVQLKEIARRQNISLHYLEHIITPLVGAGIVRSIRGARGGIQMSKRPEKVKLSEVVALLEGTMAPVDCVIDPESCRRSGSCVTRDVWSGIKNAIDKTLNSITLQDLIEREKEKELSARGKVR
jgi:Rrf2 family cysteine metabolism transcriptional repressor